MRYDLPTSRWRKSTYSNGGSGSCVETQRTADGLVHEIWRNADDLGRLFQLGARVVPGAP